MFRRKSWNRIPAYKFGYGWKPIFKCFLSQRIKRIDLNTPIFFSVRDQFQKKIWEQDSNKCAIFRSTVFVLWCVRTLSFSKFPCVCALCYIGTLPVHFCTEICSAFFDGTCSFFYFFEWNWNFFLFLPIGRFSAPAKTNKQVLVPFEKVNKQAHVPSKKAEQISVQKCTGNVPI